MAADRTPRLLAGLDPRQPIYRDSYNEYFVLLLSALGAAVVAPVGFYIVMALTELWEAWVFVAACVVLELVLIFAVGRPQMKPLERIGWALLWGAASAGLAVCFYYLVADPTL
ncbi:MAG: hypothetical protein ACM3UV_08510 [Nocardioidaceae bacterium]